MTHSVSHKLFLRLFDSELLILTQKKDGAVLGCEKHSDLNAVLLSELLVNFPDIYSSIDLVLENDSVMIIPELFYDSDVEKLYTLSNNLSVDNCLQLSRTDYGIGILFQVQNSFLKCIKNKFGNCRVRHESEIMIQKIYDEIGLEQNRVFAAIHKGYLTLIAVKDEQIHLCNSYKTESVYDVFYFIMLAYNQLQLMPSAVELRVLGNPENKAEIVELCSQYIRNIGFWNEPVNLIHSQMDPKLLESSFALQSVLCG
ncbi:MAG: DUF3822 family protein [Flavobacteriales bacterium]|nr:DUF3822 family protein [Flavobacteriales bacterium]